MKEKYDLLKMPNNRANGFQLERRAYGPDSTPEEIEAIQNRTFLYEEGIICIQEIPVTSPFSVNLIMDHAIDLGNKLSEFGLIVDVSNTTRPNAITRRAINTRFKEICNKASHISFYTGNNLLLNTVVRFVTFGANLKSYTVHSKMEDAVVAARKSLGNE